MIGNQRYEEALGRHDGDAAKLLEAGALYAHDLYDKGVEMLDQHLIRGEKAALTSYIGGLISGSNVLLVSIYGAGKTELVSHGFRVVSGIDEDNVVFVPGRPDLTPAELVGKYQVYETTSVDEQTGDKITKTETGRHQPLLHPRVQIAAFDEVTRGNPRTIDTAAQITGSRMLEAQDGKVPMLDLEMAILAMNPTESLRTTSKLSGAMSARQQWGVILSDESVWDDILEATVDKDFTPAPEKITAVSDIKKLHIARAAISLVRLDDKIRPYIKHMTKQSLHALKGHDAVILEGPARVSRQLIDTSRTFALMKGRTAVDQEDVQNAVENKLIATMGGNGVPDLGEIRQLYSQVLEAA